MKLFSRFAMISVAVLGLLSTTVRADFVDIDITGWSTFGGYDLPGGINSGTTVNIGAASTVTSVEYFDVTFETLNGSWGSELTLSVNDDDGFGAYLDWRPDVTNAPGIFGPLSGTFGTPPGVDGPFGLGTLSVTNSGSLWITAYESFDDGGVDVQDALITGGTIRINFVPIPEPSSMACLGIAAIALIARRRR